ncbi:hypothetical protein LTR78_005419 [Recurvomyces mirabilis]|uniref:Methyltransferase type 11 domain-containing protein n=1 Tax=Recurvomyces mirabilis TaxID=574656 RepID=A0AAE1C1R6_9PEZI|nr:hypothetical protein LTR78_005419 [Recurvomyces mirabilis]KAK5152675.1 hypothetical protein LTS14_008209 [Recurvomyces mirabilis]
MTTSTESKQWPVKHYTPRHTSWPYNPSDFTRQDSSVDLNFYSQPRFVTHIDDAAIVSLREYYDTVLPRKGKVLDFCSSWVSHYPPAVEQAATNGQLQITGMGMNKPELDANKMLNNGRILVDLNEHPEIATALVDAKVLASPDADDSEKLDASTNVVSTDYLTQPVAVLKSLLAATKIGGTVHLTISNRCFPTKAMSRWLRVDEEERLQMIGDYLHFAGWQGIEIVELSNGRPEESGQDEAGGGLQSFMKMMGMGHRDPLWVVRAVKK